MIGLERLDLGRRKELIAKFLKEMYLERRDDIFKWAEIRNKKI